MLKPFKAPDKIKFTHILLRCICFGTVAARNENGSVPMSYLCLKKEAKFAANNYQPISLTSQVVKVPEFIACDYVLSFSSK